MMQAITITLALAILAYLPCSLLLIFLLCPPLLELSALLSSEAYSFIVLFAPRNYVVLYLSQSIHSRLSASYYSTIYLNNLHSPAILTAHWAQRSVAISHTTHKHSKTISASAGNTSSTLATRLLSMYPSPHATSPRTRKSPSRLNPHLLSYHISKPASRPEVRGKGRAPRPLILNLAPLQGQSYEKIFIYCNT